MTLGNMRANGVRSLDVSCSLCHHRVILSADPWPDHVPVPSFGPRMVCTRCGIIGADAWPNWQEQPQRESLTGGMCLWPRSNSQSRSSLGAYEERKRLSAASRKRCL
jgi:hypothetical protein